MITPLREVFYMKKIGDLVKPFASVIFGALLLFYYLNYLQGQGQQLALGIVALIMSIYYIAVGIIASIMGDKLQANARKVFDVISMSLFPLFMFINFILMATSGFNFGPTGWILIILSMNGSLLFSALYVVAAFANVPVLKRLSQLFGAIFVLVLLVNVLYAYAGSNNPAGWVYLGEIDVILVVIYSLFSFMLFNSYKE